MKLDHIVLLLGDLEASLPYYEALLPLLGFARTRNHVWGNEDDLYLDLKQSTEPGEGYRRFGVGLNHLGFTAPDRPSLDAIAAKMREAGFEVPDFQTFGSAVALFMKDRDGIRFEITFYG